MPWHASKGGVQSQAPEKAFAAALGLHLAKSKAAECLKSHSITFNILVAEEVTGTRRILTWDY